MKLAFLYAGQGSQHVGMGQAFTRLSGFRAAFDEADAAVDFDLKKSAFTDAAGVLNETQYTQPCMTAFAAGLTAVLREQVSHRIMRRGCHWGVFRPDLRGCSMCRPRSL